MLQQAMPLHITTVKNFRMPILIHLHNEILCPYPSFTNLAACEQVKVKSKPEVQSTVITTISKYMKLKLIRIVTTKTVKYVSVMS